MKSAKLFPECIGESPTPLITGTDQLKHDRFAETSVVAEQSIDFIGSVKLKLLLPTKSITTRSLAIR